MSGWIKLKRSLLEWEWYSDHNATRLLVHLLVSVNYEDKRWRGIMIKAGSMALSWDTLSEGSGLSVKQCRVAMDKLEKSGEVGRERAGNFQVVSLVKWEKIQSGEKETDEIGQREGSVRAGKGQGKGRRGATTKEYKEREEGNNLRNEEVSMVVSNETPVQSKRFVPPTFEEAKNYFLEKKWGAKIQFDENTEAERFVDYYTSNDWKVGRNKMKDWQAAVRNWIKNIKPEQNGTGKHSNNQDELDQLRADATAVLCDTPRN